MIVKLIKRLIGRRNKTDTVAVVEKPFELPKYNAIYGKDR